MHECSIYQYDIMIQTTPKRAKIDSAVNLLLVHTPLFSTMLAMLPFC